MQDSKEQKWRNWLKKNGKKTIEPTHKKPVYFYNENLLSKCHDAPTFEKPAHPTPRVSCKKCNRWCASYKIGRWGRIKREVRDILKLFKFLGI